MTAPPLEVAGLTRRFGAFIAVRELSLTVGPGEIVGFLGPNGAGKTTTLRCCSGLLQPDAGVVRIAGATLVAGAAANGTTSAAADGLAARARLGFVPDRPFLYERLTGREFLEFVAAIYDVPEGLAAERVAALARRLELDDVLDDLVESYSLGTRQKTSIIAALVHDPPLLMLDEPLGGLDPRAARGLKDVLHERAARGLGTLVSTHLLDVAERLCDRVVVIQRGRRVAEGTLAALRAGHGDATLEDLFLELTRDPDDAEDGARGGRSA